MVRFQCILYEYRTILLCILCIYKEEWHYFKRRFPEM